MCVCNIIIMYENSGIEWNLAWEANCSIIFSFTGFWDFCGRGVGAPGVNAGLAAEDPSSASSKALSLGAASQEVHSPD